MSKQEIKLQPDDDRDAGMYFVEYKSNDGDIYHDKDKDV